MSVDDTSDHNSRQSNTIRDPPQSRTSVTECRGHRVRTRVRIHDDTDDKIEGRVADLEGVESLGEVLGLFHLGDEREERDVAGVCEDLVMKLG